MHINPTNMSISELVVGHPDPKEAMKWLTHWYAKKVDLEPSQIKELIIDGNTVFPVLRGDNLDSILSRFALLYPILAKASVEHVANMKFCNADGTSPKGLLRSLVSIPAILKAAICVTFGQDCFTNKEFLKQFSRKAPKYFTCNVSKL